MSKWFSPTKRRKRARLNCERKIGHPTLAEAEAAMREVQLAGRASEDCRAYQCDRCGMFHWGHPTGRNGGAGAGPSHVQQEVTP